MNFLNLNPPIAISLILLGILIVSIIIAVFWSRKPSWYEEDVILPDNANDDMIMDPSAIVWLFEKDKLAKIMGVSKRVMESWIDHHPEIVYEDGKIDVMALVAVRAIKLFPDDFKDGEVE